VLKTIIIIIGHNLNNFIPSFDNIIGDHEKNDKFKSIETMNKVLKNKSLFILSMWKLMTFSYDNWI
jgi:hypothetical protein